MYFSRTALVRRVRLWLLDFLWACNISVIAGVSDFSHPDHLVLLTHFVFIVHISDIISISLGNLEEES
jgi:hypothetical protein